MGHQLPARVTQVTQGQLLQAMELAWSTIVGGNPSRESLCVLLGHWALETGGGSSCVCFNIGNFKCPDPNGPHDYSYFTTWEMVLAKTAQAMVASQTPDAPCLIDRAYLNADGSVKPGPDGRVKVILKPNHPGCRFRAYSALQDGCADYLSAIHGRFGVAWPAVMAGDPRQFAAALMQAGNYTASEAEYAAGMVTRFNQFMTSASIAAAQSQPQIQFTPALPDVTPDQPNTDSDPEAAA